MPGTVETAFDTNNIRFDISTGKFILVTADHPVFANQASQAFVDKHPERFLTADQVAKHCSKAQRYLQRFPMRDGPSLPGWLGEILYAGYAVVCPNGISFEKVHASGGLSWSFVETMYKDRTGRVAINAAVKAARVSGTMPSGHYFAMQDGPYLPWELAEVVYAGYSAKYGTGQSLMRLHERSGFGWAEVSELYKDPKYKVAMDAEMKSRGFV